MKKVNLLLISMFAVLALSAQDNSGKSIEAGRKTTFVRNGFWDNWFVGAGAGANLWGGKNHNVGKFTRLSVDANVQVGKWFNPFLGARLKVEGGRVNNKMKLNGVKHTDKFNMIMPQVDFMFDVTNYFGKYNENRFYSFIPFVGMGAAYGWNYSGLSARGAADGGHQRSLTINGGLINRFRITDRLDLDLELSAAILRDDFDRQAGKVNNDIMSNASLNFVYKIGKKDFSEAVLLDQGLIDDLNGQINKLRQENAKLAQRPENCPKCPESQVVQNVTKTVFPVTNIVSFRINSANIDQSQEINIYNVSKFLQDNPDAKVKVVGYADKRTGTAAYNDKISERRAKNVANALINKYNVNNSRVDVEWKGASEQPFTENAWNRVAIFVVQD